MTIDHGNPDDFKSDLFAEAYDHLHGLAEARLRSQRAGHTLQATALVHEVYLKFAKDPTGAPLDRQHFLAIAATAMRQVLVDHARRKSTEKRGGSWSRLTISDVIADGPDWSVLDLHHALEELTKLDARQAKIVDLRVFAGLTVQQTADVLGVSERTVFADWRMARAWLNRALQGHESR